MSKTSTASSRSIPRPRRCSRHVSWGCWIASVLASWLLAGLAWAGPGGLPTGVAALGAASATLMPATGPAAESPVRLPHRWDLSYPRSEGRVWYRLALPPVPPGQPMGLFIPRLGNQAEVRVAGHVIGRFGTLDDPRSDAAKAPIWISVSSNLLDPVSATPLEVEATVQSGRWGGLSEIYFGPEAALRPLYQDNYRWRQTAAVVIVLSLGLMGLVAAGLWLRQHEALYGLFALTALFGIVRMGDRLLSQPPLPWPLWGAVAALAFALHTLLIVQFSARVIGYDRPWVRRGLWAFVAWAVAGALLAFLARMPGLWTAVLASLLVPSALMLGLVLRQAWRSQSRDAILLSTAGLIAVAAGLRDFAVVRWSSAGSAAFSVLPHAVFVFVLFMAWIIVDRFSRQVLQYRELNTTLEQRIAEREAQLSRSYEQLQRQSDEQAALQERQRIMRDIHDGVGSQLVGLLGLLRHGDIRREAMEEHVHAALDELRMAVDALQPVHGDLATVLATLRYRLQPRLEAAGLEVVWDVSELPPLAGLTPPVVLQIQRVLLEAFTNVLRHAQARKVEVAARHALDPPRLVLEVGDDGVGWPPAGAGAASPGGAGGGQGLASMRARAEAIGAHLVLAARPGGGARVSLELALG